MSVLRQRVKGLEEAVVLLSEEAEELHEAKRNTLAYYQTKAFANFLKAAAGQIKKIAGSHAEAVTTKVSTMSAWLSYRGQDRSDMDLEFGVFLYPGTVEKVKIIFWSESVYGGKKEEDKFISPGALTTDFIVSKFRESFGR